MKSCEDFPIGLSGIMRCRDHAGFLELCVESCIHALDELVAVYHDSTDATLEILQQLQKKYPNKLRLYEYPYYIFPISLDREMYEYVVRLDEATSNSFHDYCNFVLSKARFRYVVKIDADHICFPKRLKQICDAYRSDERKMITGIEYAAMDAYKTGRLESEGYASYMSYVLKRIVNDKVPVSFSGINVFVKDRKLKVCLGASDDNNYYPLFNGVHDHFFFTNTGEPQFEKYLSPDNPKGKNRILELLPCNDPLLDGGFLWYHVKNLMGRDYYDSVEMMSARPELFVPLSLLEDSSFDDFENNYHPVVPFAHMLGTYRLLFDASKPFIDKGLKDSIMTAYNNIYYPARMDTEKYTDEYSNEVEFIINQYINQFGHLMSFDGCDLIDAVRMLLKQHSRRETDHYVRCREAGKTIEESLDRLIRCFELFADKSLSAVSRYLQITPATLHPWEMVLSEYDGAFIIHIHDESQINRILSLDVSEDITVVLVCDTELPDETELPDNFVVLTLGWSDMKICDNQFLETNFPYVYHCANAMEWIIRIMRPSCVTSFADTSVSGCIVSAIAKKHGMGYE